MNEATQPALVSTCETCRTCFIPTVPWKRYCTERCQMKAAAGRHRQKLPPVGERIPGKQSEIRQCVACAGPFDTAIRRSTSSGKHCSHNCYEWHRTHPGQMRVSGRTCEPCGASIDHRRQSAKTCGSRQCMWWNLHHPGEPLPGDRLCKACQQPIMGRAITATTCSTACKAWIKTYPNGERIRPLSRSCATCGVDISDRGSRAIFCSESCFGRSPAVLAKARASAKRRRVKLAGCLVIPFTDEQLAQRLSMFGSRCYICGSTDRVTVDHVKPVAHGGPHCLSNFRPLCKSCNSAKYDAWPLPPALLTASGDAPSRLVLLKQAGRAARKSRT